LSGSKLKIVLPFLVTIAINAHQSVAYSWRIYYLVITKFILSIVSSSKWYIKDNIEDTFAHFTFTNPPPVIDFSKQLVRTFDDGDSSRYKFNCYFVKSVLTVIAFDVRYVNWTRFIKIQSTFICVLPMA